MRLVAPDGWSVSPAEHELTLGPHGEGVVTFHVEATGAGRVGADLTVGGTRFGLQAEAIVE